MKSWTIAKITVRRHSDCNIRQKSFFLIATHRNRSLSIYNTVTATGVITCVSNPQLPSVCRNRFILVKEPFCHWLPGNETHEHITQRQYVYLYFFRLAKNPKVFTSRTSTLLVAKRETKIQLLTTERWEKKSFDSQWGMSKTSHSLLFLS